MSTKVSEAMTSDVQCVTPSQSLREAAVLMRDNDVGSIPVVDGNLLVGILTDRDIVVRGVAESADPSALSVRDVASTDLTATYPEQDLDQALELMAENQVRRLPVLENGRLVGILAQADAAIAGKPTKAGKMLEEISQPASVVQR